MRQHSRGPVLWPAVVIGLILAAWAPPASQAAQSNTKPAVGIARKLWNDDAFRQRLQYFRLQQQQNLQYQQLQQQLGMAQSQQREQNRLQHEFYELDREQALQDRQLLQSQLQNLNRPHYGRHRHGLWVPRLR